MPFGIIDTRESKEDEFLPGTEHLIGDHNVAAAAALAGNETRREQLKHVMYKVSSSYLSTSKTKTKTKAGSCRDTTPTAMSRN